MTDETTETRIRVLPGTLSRLNALETELYGSSNEISHEIMLRHLIDYFAEQADGIDLSD